MRFRDRVARIIDSFASFTPLLLLEPGFLINCAYKALLFFFNRPRIVFYAVFIKFFQTVLLL